MIFVKPRLMRWNNNAISDHNRGDLSISPERIERKQRMVDGTLRKYVVADKRSFSVNWKDLPHHSAYTVDGFWGADQIRAFYTSTIGAFNLELTYGNGAVETISVMFADINASITKRGRYDFWQVNVTMEEV